MGRLGLPLLGPSNSLPLGDHTLSAKVTSSFGEERCVGTPLSYTVLEGNIASIKDQKTSGFEESLEIEVANPRGDEISIFSDSSCSELLGSKINDQENPLKINLTLTQKGNYEILLERRCLFEHSLRFFSFKRTPSSRIQKSQHLFWL